jgi:hypothetical protein
VPGARRAQRPVYAGAGCEVMKSLSPPHEFYRMKGKAQIRGPRGRKQACSKETPSAGKLLVHGQTPPARSPDGQRPAPRAAPVQEARAWRPVTGRHLLTGLRHRGNAHRADADFRPCRLRRSHPANLGDLVRHAARGPLLPRGGPPSIPRPAAPTWWPGRISARGSHRSPSSRWGYRLPARPRRNRMEYGTPVVGMRPATRGGDSGELRVRVLPNLARGGVSASSNDRLRTVWLARARILPRFAARQKGHDH